MTFVKRAQFYWLTLFILGMALPAHAGVADDATRAWDSIRNYFSNLGWSADIAFTYDFTWLYVIAAGLLALIAYYLLAWSKVGRDPQRGQITIQYAPPVGLSPAAVRYLTAKLYDYKSFAAAIIDLAVNGKVGISTEEVHYRTEDESGYQTLYRISPSEGAASSTGLPAEEQAIMQELLATPKPLVFSDQGKGYFSDTKCRRAGAITDSIKAALVSQYGNNKCFSTNFKYVAIGLATSLVMLLGLVVYTAFYRISEPFIVYYQGSSVADNQYFDMSFYFWGTILLLFGALLLSAAITGIWRHNQSGLAIFMALLFGLPVSVCALVMLVQASVTYAIFLLGVICVNGIFIRLLPAYTPAGRVLMNQVEGFRKYLVGAHADPMTNMHAPRVTPEVFERYLPYALALEVEYQWAKQLDAGLNQVGQQYQPAWFSGAADSSVVDFTRTLSFGFAMAILSSAPHPVAQWAKERGWQLTDTT